MLYEVEFEGGTKIEVEASNRDSAINNACIAKAKTDPNTSFLVITCRKISAIYQKQKQYYTKRA